MDIALDRSSGLPLARQISEGIRDAVRRGDLDVGARLPSERDLARSLGVDRMTVARAYMDLVAAGVVTRHVGRGTFISESAGKPEPGRPATAGILWSSAFASRWGAPGSGSIASLHASAPEGAVNFSSLFPDPALFPIADFRRALDAAIRREGAALFGYGSAAGYPPLRRHLAATLRAKGVVLEDDEVLVTNGSQQGIDLVARTFLEPGDAAVVENPTYTGAVQVFHAIGARVVGVPVDGEGMRPDRLEEALGGREAKLIYLMPNFQNPTSGTMSLARRRRLVEIAAAHRVPILEDDFGGDLRFEGDERPPLKALDPTGGVLYVSSFAKKLLPGLRIGWIAAPREAADRLVHLKQITDWSTSLLLQGALHEFCERGALEKHLRRVRVVYRKRRDAMLAAMAESFPKEARWTRPEGGLVVWVTLPSGVDADEVALEARGRGVLVGRGDLFYVDGGPHANLRLVYAQAEPAEIRKGIRLLGSILTRKLKERRSQPQAAPEPIPMI